jgi:hypothetical protein
VFLVLTISYKVTVLLFILESSGILRANDLNRNNMRMFEFTSEFYMPMGDGRLDGLMASDGLRHRIVIYWIEPAVYHDSSFFLGYSDFIFEKDIVHYWVQSQSEPGTFDMSGRESDNLLTRDASPESVALSALAIVSRIRSKSEESDIPLEVGKFFRQSRDSSDYSYEVPSEQTSSEDSFISSLSDEQILNALPYGRKYSKETQTDGTIVWCAQRVLDGPQVARVTVKPISSDEYDYDKSMFDPNTLGHWTLVPEPYRIYWSLDQVCSKLQDTPDQVQRRELYGKIESYINKNNIPERIDIAFNKLLFKTAMLTGDKKSVSRSAHSLVAALFRVSSMNDYQNLLELARIDNQIREQYPEQADELVFPLVGLMIKHIGQDAPNSIEILMPTIENNKWFSYGKLLVEEVRFQALVEKDIADTLADRLEASHLARTRQPFDPCETCESVRHYMAKIDEYPPKGNLSMEDIREILEKGLARPYADANPDSKGDVIENVSRSIQLIVGEGPFVGDKDRLIKSVERFSGLYLVVFRYQEPIDTVLATFLALSFCDTSTQEDHDVLFSQIQKLCAEFQTQTNNMLAERGLDVLVEPNDVERLFTRYKQRFRNYVDDPLWPAFKFPLTTNEQTRLRNKLKLSFDKLEPIFEEMALKVKYGGISDELKQRTCYEIASAILQLLPQAAFLRRPSYPGVSCRHRGGYGFAAAIRGPLYIEGERPKEKFRAMKYFHIGHRLEDIVKRERELVERR